MKIANNLAKKFQNMGVCNSTKKWKVADPVMTPYGEGRIIEIRKNNYVPYVVVLPYGVGYFTEECLKPYEFTTKK
jgi:hypothetical protein